METEKTDSPILETGDEILNSQEVLPPENKALSDIPKYSRREFGLILGGLFCAASGLARPEKDPNRHQASLYTLKNKENFPGREWAVLANTPAFEGLGKGLCASKEGREFLSGKDTLTFLYPGAGIHLAPLGAVRAIAERMENLKRVRMIYTEIDPKSYEEIDRHLKKIVEKTPGFSNLIIKETVFNQEDKNSPKQKAMLFDYQRPNGTVATIELTFEFKRSGEEYYRQEHFDAADILIEHDSTSKGFESFYAVVEMYLRSFKTSPSDQRKLFFCAHDDVRAEGSQLRGLMYEAIGNVLHIEENQWGCGNNHRDTDPRKESHFHKAAVLELDTEFLKEIVKDEKATDAFLALLIFARTRKKDLQYLSFDKKAILEARKKALEAMETVLLFLEGKKDPELETKVADILLTFLSERFFYASFDNLPALNQRLYKHLSAHSEKIDLPDFKPEEEIIKYFRESWWHKGKEQFRIHWRKNRLLAVLRVIEEKKVAADDPVRSNLARIIEIEINTWFDSPELRKFLEVFVSNQSFILDYSLRQKEFIKQYHPKATHTSAKQSEAGYFQMENVPIRSEDYDPKNAYFRMLTNEIFEYFMAILYIAKKLGLDGYKKICGQFDTLTATPPSGTFSGISYEMCVKSQ